MKGALLGSVLYNKSLWTGGMICDAMGDIINRKSRPLYTVQIFAMYRANTISHKACYKFLCSFRFGNARMIHLVL